MKEKYIYILLGSFAEPYLFDRDSVPDPDSKMMDFLFLIPDPTLKLIGIRIRS